MNGRDEGLAGKLRREAGLLPRVTHGPDGTRPYEPTPAELRRRGRLSDARCPDCSRRLLPFPWRCPRCARTMTNSEVTTIEGIRP